MKIKITDKTSIEIYPAGFILLVVVVWWVVSQYLS